MILVPLKRSEPQLSNDTKIIKFLQILVHFMNNFRLKLRRYAYKIRRDPAARYLIALHRVPRPHLTRQRRRIPEELLATPPRARGTPHGIAGGFDDLQVSLGGGEVLGHAVGGGGFAEGGGRPVTSEGHVVEFVLGINEITNIYVIRQKKK